MDIKDLFIIENGDLISINEIVNIPSGITKLERCCFRGCNFIKEINIPATCVDIDQYAFEDLDSVLSYNVDKDNPKYTSYDGCIYSKDKKKPEVINVVGECVKVKFSIDDIKSSSIYLKTIVLHVKTTETIEKVTIIVGKTMKFKPYKLKKMLLNSKINFHCLKHSKYVLTGAGKILDNIEKI